jgi:hypothetical protein
MANEMIGNLATENLAASHMILPTPVLSAAPSHVPPPAQAGAAMASALTLQTLSAADLKLLHGGTTATPTMATAGIGAQAAAASGTVWQSGKTITNQWTINQDRNSWIGVAGIGWQKLSTASDSGCVSLTMLAGSALITKASVSYRTESDGMVHEMYVF